MLSPKDHRWVEQWYRAEIPSDVVVTGIKDAFSQSVPRRVHSLAFVAPAVERAAQSHRTRKVGGALLERDDDLIVAERLSRLLSQIRAAGSAHDEPRVIQLLANAAQEVEAATSKWKQIPEFDLGSALESLEKETLDFGLGVMPPNQRADLEAEVQGALAEHPPMQSLVYEQTRLAFTQRRIRRYLGIPAFDCTSGGGW